MDSGIIIAIITALGSIAAVVITNYSSNKEVSRKIDAQHAIFEEGMRHEIGALRKEVERHNNVISRTFDLEKRTEILAEKIKDASRRIDDLERSGK